ncbi:ATP-binding protein [Limnobacter sp.]|uniref:HAMP domain-containing sensor histidine kinase n=1 Tax=Limnobacter sp. TaxID=2003368 RepID=UPI0035139317
MGKLFWKFFFGFWLCLLVAALATGTALYVLRQKPGSTDLAEGPRAQFLLETMQNVLEGKGPNALKDLLERNRLRTGTAIPVFAVREDGQELLGREVPQNIAPRLADVFTSDGPAEAGMLLVNAQDESRWLLFIPRHRRPPPPASTEDVVEPHAEAASQGAALRRQREALEPPLPPFSGPGLVAALLASLLFAGVLAYTFSRPLNKLKNAFREAAKGRLGVRISKGGKRKDEIGELLSGFDQMAKEIESRIQQQKALLHDVSHELRSPLARLNLAVGLARQRPDHLETSLSRIETEAERLDSLIGELLNLSRLESEELDGAAQANNALELLAGVVDDARFEAEQQGKQVQWGCPMDAHWLPCEPDVLQRAFDNVIRNALKHSPAGGVVEVSCSQRGPAGLQVDILDRGPGVPPEHMNKLFTPFFKQGEKSGHGLGLAIAKRAIERHQGRISAHTRPGGGMVFRIELPGAGVKPRGN